MSTSVPPVEEIEEAAVSDNLDELNDIILPETEPEPEVAGRRRSMRLRK